MGTAWSLSELESSQIDPTYCGFENCQILENFTPFEPNFEKFVYQE